MKAIFLKYSISASVTLTALAVDLMFVRIQCIGLKI